jgi:predicted metalloprotease
VWRSFFRRALLPFTPARLEIISGSAQKSSSCRVLTNSGPQEIVVTRDSPLGPFYCAIDGPGTIYMPTTTTRRIVFRNAPDFRSRPYQQQDFAIAFIVAHEWGHHVQNLLGKRFADFSPRRPSIQRELQADCLAGTWAYSAGWRNLLERGDVVEGVQLAASIGDVQSRSPAAPTAHGTSAQRVKYFLQGLTTGRPGSCDTRTVSAR